MSLRSGGGSQRRRPPKVGEQKPLWVPVKVREEEKRKALEQAKDPADNARLQRFLKRVPQDDVWVRAHYPRPKYSLERALQMHREFNSPEMFDNMSGRLFFTAHLNMRTPKKTKFVSDFKNTVLLPHYFEDDTENRLLVFCKTADERERALELGAAFSGGAELMAAIKEGEISSNDYDTAVCTVDMIEELASMRKFLPEFPSKAKGTMGVSVDSLMDFFKRGKMFWSEKTSDTEAIVQVDFGILEWPTEHLQENFNVFLEAFEAARSKAATSMGSFVTKAYVTCPPSSEKFEIHPSDLVPPSVRKAAELKEAEQLESAARA